VIRSAGLKKGVRTGGDRSRRRKWPIVSEIEKGAHVSQLKKSNNRPSADQRNRKEKQSGLNLRTHQKEGALVFYQHKLAIGTSTLWGVNKDTKNKSRRRKTGQQQTLSKSGMLLEKLRFRTGGKWTKTRKGQGFRQIQKKKAGRYAGGAKAVSPAIKGRKHGEKKNLGLEARSVPPSRKKRWGLQNGKEQGKMKVDMPGCLASGQKRKPGSGKFKFACTSVGGGKGFDPRKKSVTREGFPGPFSRGRRRAMGWAEQNEDIPL